MHRNTHSSTEWVFFYFKKQTLFPQKTLLNTIILMNTFYMQVLLAERNTMSQYRKVMKSTRIPPSYSPAKGITKLLSIIAIVFLLLLVIFNSIYFVGETQTAVVKTFGAAQEVPEKGMHFKIPFIQTVTKVDTTIRNIYLGYGVDKSGSVYDVDSESVMITNDMNFIDVDYNVSYMVTDPIKYLYNASNPEAILKNLSLEVIRSIVAAYPVDAVLTTGKTEIQYNIKNMLISRLEAEDIGITVVETSMQDVEPPIDSVIYAFKAVETAKQEKETKINNANKYRNEQLPQAQARADEIVQSATAQATARINEANGQVARFESEYAEYIKYPLITKQRMFYETMEELLPQLKVIIDTGTGIQKYYPVEQFANINVGG